MCLHRKFLQSGYTLLELSLVLAIVALLVAGIMAVVTQTQRQNASAEVQAKMDAIEAALLDFRRLNNRLPCPADSTQTISSQYFGVEGTATASASTAPITCINGDTYASSYASTANPPDASFYDAPNTVAGDVPVRTLGLPDEDMFDPWGGRFFYVVDMRLTTTNAPFISPYSITGTPVGSITVDDNAANVKTANAVVVLISFGPDGHGAFQLSGTRKAVGNTNAGTAANCHCGSGAAAVAWPNPPVFIQAPATSSNPTDPASFDDIVRYYTRSSFLNNADTSAAR